MKTKLHLLFFAVLFSVGLHAQSITVTSSLPAAIETGDPLDFTVNYDTNNVSPYSLIVRLYTSTDGGETFTRFGNDQGYKNLTIVSGTETISVNAPLVAGNYYARVFVENPDGYAKVFADAIAFTITAAVLPVKAIYLFDTDADIEGWEVGSDGGPNATATVASGAMTVNIGGGSWKPVYIEQEEFRLDPSQHTYVHITYKNLSKPNENNRIKLDWITTGGLRSSGAVFPVETSGWNDPMPEFVTVTHNLGADAEWVDGDAGTMADATNFRIYVTKESGTGTKDRDFLIDSIEFSNSATPGGSTPTVNTFTGTAGNDWNDMTNWSSGAVPTSADDAVIPAGQTVQVDFETGAEVKDLSIDGAGSLTISHGGSLKVSGTSTGNINYNIDVYDLDWHLVAAPFSGQDYDNNWVSDSNIAHGSQNTNHRGIATYQNGTAHASTGNWVYMLEGESGTFGDGIGYSLKAQISQQIALKTANAIIGTYSFEGTYPTLPIASPITQGSSSNWNLIGNSTPAYLKIEDLITANGAKFSAAYGAIYVSSGTTYVGVTSGYLHPGQAYFVSSINASDNVSTTDAMLFSYGAATSATTFLKSGHTSVNLMISEGGVTRKAYLEYRNDATLGLDPGKDLGSFTGVSNDFSIYTNLLEDGNNIAFERQALPDSDLETMEVAVGVKATAGKEITISATSLNLPEGIKVFLEDRALNVFTNLNDGDYTITLDTALNGVGRFFLRTANTVLSTESVSLSNVKIYNTNNNTTLRIVGLEQGASKVKMFNVLGKQVLRSSFEANNGVKEISLPRLAAGVYIVKLEVEKGTLNKKIILE